MKGLLTLRLLATRTAYHHLQHTFKISKPVLSKTIPEVYDAIVEVLRDYIQVSNNYKKN
ncbi:hypothetical protein PGB90_004909 [Kerria lacca]